MKTFRQHLTEGEVVRMRPYDKPKENQDPGEPTHTWAHEAEKGHWQALHQLKYHYENPPKMGKHDELSAGGNMVPGVPTPALEDRVKWAVSGPEMFSYKEKNALQKGLHKHGFGYGIGGGGKTTTSSMNAWHQLAHGTRTTRHDLTLSNRDSDKSPIEHRITVSKHADDGNGMTMSWEHTERRANWTNRSRFKDPNRVVARGSDYQSLEDHVNKHFDPSTGKPGQYSFSPPRVKYVAKPKPKGETE